MTTTPFPESAYRKAERQYGPNSDALWEYLEENRHMEPTLAIGWAIERARRYFNLDQVQIASRTAVYDGQGQLLEEPISKSFVSAMLSGRSRVSPPVYKRLARACEVNPIDFHIAEGWEDLPDVAAYDLPDREMALPILRRILRLPPDQRPHAHAVVLSVLDSIYGAATGENPEKEVSDGSVPFLLAGSRSLLEREAGR